MLSNPKACRVLTDEEFANLRRLNPGVWSSPSRECITCGKKGIIKVMDRSTGRIEEVECACREQWKLHLWLLNAGIGARYQRLGWADADGVSQSVKDQVMKWLTESDERVRLGMGLTLWSPNRGTGKTLMANLMAKYLMASGHDTFVSIFTELLNRAQDGWRDKEARIWFESRIQNSPVLVIDDIGREHQGRMELVESMLDPIVRWRVANERPTIITTNFNPDEMKGRYGSNIISLLSEANTPIEVSGQDFRMTSFREREVAEAVQGIVRPLTVL